MSSAQWGFGFHDYGNAVAGFLPGQRAFGKRVGTVLPEYLVDVYVCRHEVSPKKKPGHEDRARASLWKRKWDQ